MYSFTAYIPDERPGCYSPCEKKDFFRLNELVGLVTHRIFQFQLRAWPFVASTRVKLHLAEKN